MEKDAEAQQAPIIDKTAPTPRQAAVLEFIRARIMRDLTSPTLREIGDHFGIRAPGGAVCHLRALAKKGFITINPSVSRGIRLVYQPGCCPLCHRVMEGVA